MTNSRLAGIILAGGKSSRMGTPKALLPIGPETMLQRVVRLLSTAASPVVVVAAEGQALPVLPSDCLVARDRRPERGPLEGFAVGLAAIAPIAEAAYITSCDAPLLVPGFVRRLFELLDEYDAAVPVDGERPHPLSAVYRIRALPAIERLLASDRLKVSGLLDEIRTKFISAADLQSVDPDLATLRNANHPAEYAAILTLASQFAPKIGNPPAKD